PFASLFVRTKAHTPINLLLEQEIPLALATDFNPGTAMCHDLILAARLGVCYLGLDIESALISITRTAAKSLGRADIGVLRVGNKADILVTRCSFVNDLFYDWNNKPLHAILKN